MSNPRIFGTCSVITTTASPARYPRRAGAEISSVMVPAFASPAAMQSTPTVTLRKLPSAMRSPLVVANGMIAAAIRGASDESGPSTSRREGPNTA